MKRAGTALRWRDLPHHAATLGLTIHGDGLHRSTAADVAIMRDGALSVLNR
jgi:hypothetical protein